MARRDDVPRRELVAEAATGLVDQHGPLTVERLGQQRNLVARQGRDQPPTASGVRRAPAPSGGTARTPGRRARHRRGRPSPARRRPLRPASWSPPTGARTPRWRARRRVPPRRRPVGSVEQRVSTPTTSLARPPARSRSIAILVAPRSAARETSSPLRCKARTSSAPVASWACTMRCAPCAASCPSAREPSPARSKRAPNHSSQADDIGAGVGHGPGDTAVDQSAPAATVSAAWSVSPAALGRPPRPCPPCAHGDEPPSPGIRSASTTTSPSTRPRCRPRRLRMPAPVPGHPVRRRPATKSPHASSKSQRGRQPGHPGAVRRPRQTAGPSRRTSRPRPPSSHAPV